MKTITQLIIQFSCDSPEEAGDIVNRITEQLAVATHCNTFPKNILIKVEQTIHPEA